MGSVWKNPVVLTNFIGDIKSLFTLAHEIGHCLHSFIQTQIITMIQQDIRYLLLK